MANTHSLRKKSLKNLLWAALGHIITIAIGLILPRLFITGFGSETNGLINSAQQFLAYFSLFEAGIGAISLQAIYKPIAEGNHDQVSGTLSATHVYYKRTGTLYLITLTAFSLVYPFLAHSSINYFIVAGVVFLTGIGNVVMFFFQGKYKILLRADGKSYIISNLTTITTVITGLTKVLMISMGFDVITVLAASFAISLIQAVFIPLYIKKHYVWLNIKYKPDYQSISQKNYILIHQIAYIVFQNTDILILTVICGLKVVSVYSLYKLVITHLESILNIISDSVEFALGQIFQVDRQRFIKRIDVFESLYSALSFSMFSTIYCVFLPFMKIYTHGVTDINYIDFWLPVLFCTIAILTAMRKPMLMTINFAGHFKLTTPQTVAETIINLTVSLVSVWFLGIYGVLLGTVVALLYRTTDVIIYSNKKILKRSCKKTLSIYAVCFVDTALIQAAFYLVSPTIDSIIKLIVAGIILIVVHLVLFLGSQILVFKDFRNTAHALLGKLLRRKIKA